MLFLLKKTCRKYDRFHSLYYGYIDLFYMGTHQFTYDCFLILSNANANM